MSTHVADLYTLQEDLMLKITQICRYLVATQHKGLTFDVDCNSLKLNCFVDADFEGLHKYEDHNDPISAKSRTRYVIPIWGSPISWCSKL